MCAFLTYLFTFLPFSPRSAFRMTTALRDPEYRVFSPLPPYNGLFFDWPGNDRIAGRFIV